MSVMCTKLQNYALCMLGEYESDKFIHPVWMTAPQTASLNKVNDYLSALQTKPGVQWTTGSRVNASEQQLPLFKFYTKVANKSHSYLT